MIYANFNFVKTGLSYVKVKYFNHRERAVLCVLIMYFRKMSQSILSLKKFTKKIDLPPYPECPVRKHGDEGVYN